MCVYVTKRKRETTDLRESKSGVEKMGGIGGKNQSGGNDIIIFSFSFLKIEEPGHWNAMSQEGIRTAHWCQDFQLYNSFSAAHRQRKLVTSLKGTFCTINLLITCLKLWISPEIIQYTYNVYTTKFCPISMVCMSPDSHVKHRCLVMIHRPSANRKSNGPIRSQPPFVQCSPSLGGGDIDFSFGPSVKQLYTLYYTIL